MTEIRPTTFTLADLRGRELVWVFEFRWGGAVLYLGAESIEDEDAPLGEDGADVPVVSGLSWSDEQPDEVELLQDTAQDKRASVTLQLWPHLDVPQLVADGHVLGAATGRLHLWARGTDHAITIIDGDFQDPTWDLSETPITGTLAEDPQADRALHPPADARVDSTSWPLHDPAVEGEYYPDVFGGPGTNDSTAAWTPGLLVDTTDTVPHPSKLLIGGHRCPTASNVQIRNMTTEATETRGVSHEADGYGRVCAYVQPSTGFVSEGDEVWVNWYSGGQVWGRVSLRDATAPLRGAGDLLEWWLTRSTIRWDRGRLAAIRDRLNVYKIDTYAQADPGSRLGPWRWIQDNLLPLLPVSTRIGPNGLYFLLWDLSTTTDRAVAHLEEGLNCTRGGPVRSSPLDDVATEIAVAYQFGPSTGDPEARLVVTGDDTTLAEDPDAARNLYARQSRLQYGRNIPDEIQARHVLDAGTASKVLHTEIRLRATQWDLLDYAADQEVAGRLHPGDLVTLTDSDRNIANRPALVVSRPWVSTGGRIPIELQAPPAALENPV